MVRLTDPATGTTNRYAERAYHRFASLGFYLARMRAIGHEKAARQTCDLYGHDRHGARCDRCGDPLR